MIFLCLYLRALLVLTWLLASVCARACAYVASENKALEVLPTSISSSRCKCWLARDWLAKLQWLLLLYRATRAEHSGQFILACKSVPAPVQPFSKCNACVMSPDLVIIAWRVLSCSLRENLVVFPTRAKLWMFWCIERNVVELNRLNEFWRFVYVHHFTMCINCSFSYQWGGLFNQISGPNICLIYGFSGQLDLSEEVSKLIILLNLLHEISWQINTFLSS